MMSTTDPREQALRLATSQRLREAELRARVAPLPEDRLYYPTPWRVAETRGDQTVVVCADGAYTAYAPSVEAAEIIVAAVNAWAVTS